MSRVKLDQHKLEAAAQALFRTQSAQDAGLRIELGDEPHTLLWNDLPEAKREQLIEQAYVVLRVWNIGG